MPAYSPNDAIARHGETIPEEILGIVNDFLVARVHRKSFIISQQEIVDKLSLTSITEAEALDKGWFDFEDAYRRRGWRVTYDRPGFNESYGAFWRFQVAR